MPFGQGSAVAMHLRPGNLDYLAKLVVLLSPLVSHSLKQPTSIPFTFPRQLIDLKMPGP